MRPRRTLTRLALLASLLFLTQCTFEDYLADRASAAQSLVNALLGLTDITATKAKHNFPSHKPLATRSEPKKTPKPGEWGKCDDSKEPVAKTQVVRAEVVIEKIRLKNEASQKWTTVALRPRMIDLVRLAPTLSEILSKATLPEGEFNEIEVITQNGHVSDLTGKKFPLSVSGGLSAGIQIKLTRNLLVSSKHEARSISLSFCTENNFQVKTENPSREFIFHPVIDNVINISL